MHPELTIEHNYSLQRLNTFGITANAAAYVRITSQAQLQAALQDPALSAMPGQARPGARFIGHLSEINRGNC